MGIVNDYREYLVNQTSLMPESIALYTRTISLFFIHSRFRRDMKDKELVATINEFITEHTKDKRSYYVRAPFKFFLDMKEKQHLFSKIKTFKKLPRKKNYEDLSKEILMRVLDSIDNPLYRLIAKIQYETGARASDIIRTKRGSVKGNDKDGYQIRIIGKGARERWADLSKELAKGVLYLEGSVHRDLIFVRTQSKDERRSIKTVYHYYWLHLRRAVERVGVDFSTHYFRRKYITDALREGFDIFSVQRDIGHKRIDTTIRYMLENNTEREIAKKIRGIE